MSGRPNAPAYVAAVNWAIETITQDNSLFKGYEVQIEYTVYDTGRTPESGVVGAGKLLRDGIEDVNVVIGPEKEPVAFIQAEVLLPWQMVNIIQSGGVSLADPKTKNSKIPYCIGSIVSGLKILPLFPLILSRWKIPEINFIAPEDDTVFPVLIPILKKEKIIAYSNTYTPWKDEVNTTQEKIDKFKILKRTGLRGVGSADRFVLSVKENLLALRANGMTGLGWVLINNVVNPIEVANGYLEGASDKAMDWPRKFGRVDEVYEAMQGWVVIDYLRPYDFPLFPAFKKGILERLQGELPQAWKRDAEWDKRYQQFLATARKESLPVLEGTASEAENRAVDRDLFCPECYYAQCARLPVALPPSLGSACVRGPPTLCLPRRARTDASQSACPNARHALQCCMGSLPYTCPRLRCCALAAVPRG